MSPKPQRLLPAVAGAIFAGGESRRMGQPKEGLRLWDNRPMLAHVVDALAPLCSTLVVVGQCLGYNTEVDSRLTKIIDRQAGLGPLSALDALLSSDLSTHYLVTSCDQPLLEPALLQLLLDETESNPDQPIFFQSQDGIGLDPFPGLYPASLLPFVEQALAEGQYSIRKMLHEQPIHWVPLPVGKDYCLSNCNTPAAVAALPQGAQPKEPVL